MAPGMYNKGQGQIRSERKALRSLRAAEDCPTFHQRAIIHFISAQNIAAIRGSVFFKVMKGQVSEWTFIVLPGPHIGCLSSSRCSRWSRSFGSPDVSKVTKIMSSQSSVKNSIFKLSRRDKSSSTQGHECRASTSQLESGGGKSDCRQPHAFSEAALNCKHLHVCLLYLPFSLCVLLCFFFQIACRPFAGLLVWFLCFPFMPSPSKDWEKQVDKIPG